jgi:hypothetical protein
MVLGELGKVINKEPKAVISALQDAGIKVPRNPSKRDLVRLIIVNKRNKNLVQNLSVLITASATATDSFLNLTKEEEEKLPILSASEGLTGLSKGTTELAGTKKDGGFLQKVGAWFQKRKADKQLNPTKAGSATEQTNWQRFTSWFTKNRDTINQVGNTLYTSLGSANQNQIPTGDGGGSGSGGSGAGADQTWIQKNKVLVVVGLIAVAGGIYFFTRGKGKGKK